MSREIGKDYLTELVNNAPLNSHEQYRYVNQWIDIFIYSSSFVLLILLLITAYFLVSAIKGVDENQI